MPASPRQEHNNVFNGTHTARLSKLGKKINAFYQVPEGLDKPVGLRKYPHKLSARTGDNLIPGEVRESTQELYIDGTKFIKIVGPTEGV